MVDTVLTAGQTEEERKKNRAAELDWERFRILLDIGYEFYISEEAKPDLAAFCRIIVRIGNDFEGETFSSIPENGRNRLIGEIVVKAVNFDKNRILGAKTKPVSNKSLFQSLVVGLVNLAHKDDHSKNKKRHTKLPTAFEVTSELLKRYGITKNGKRIPVSTISNWCD